MLDGKKIGFIGAGTMAEAIARGLIDAGVKPEDIAAYDPDERRREFFADELDIHLADGNREVVDFADIIVLAVKPGVVESVLSEVGKDIRSEQLLISIAAGIPMQSISNRLPESVPVVRVMPNTPCLIGQGISALSPGSHATAEHVDMAAAIFGAVGRVVIVTEDKMDAVTGLSGSGPAYVYMFIEALANGGVGMGLPRQTALLLAAQTVAGAANMVLESGEHPAELRDKVTTPGGTTIAAIASLESAGFRSAVMDAVRAATDRASELGKR